MGEGGGDGWDGEGGVGGKCRKLYLNNNKIIFLKVHINFSTCVYQMSIIDVAWHWPQNWGCVVTNSSRMTKQQTDSATG